MRSVYGGGRCPTWRTGYLECVFERPVNINEFQLIQIVQKFERLGWLKALDWCVGIPTKVYLQAVTAWMESLKLDREDDNPYNWRLIGDVGRRKMIMSFETLNQIAEFDSLGVGEY